MSARRIILAVTAIGLWLGGIEVLPNLHIALHAQLAPHVHDGDSTIYTHRHEPARSSRTDRATALLDLAMRLEHGAHSFAHHAVAMQPAPAPVLLPLPFHRHLTELPELAIIEPSSHSVPDAAARGPPSLFV